MRGFRKPRGISKTPAYPLHYGPRRTACGTCSLRSASTQCPWKRGQWVVAKLQSLHFVRTRKRPRSLPGTTPQNANLGNLTVGARCLETGTPGARASELGKTEGGNPGWPNQFVQLMLLIKVCDQETDARHKCRCVLMVSKVGASPTRGTSGNLVTRALWDGSPKQEKNLRRCHGPSGLEATGEREMKGVTP